MYSVIRKYQFDPKDAAELDRQVRDGFIPIIEKARGFLAYYWLNTGQGQGASISVFEDEEGAEESVRLAADFIQQKNLATFIGKPEITKGPIQAHAVAMSLK